MKPYYSEDGITIYHGDCREVLPSLEGYFRVLTDQPYGTGWATGGGLKQGQWTAKHQGASWDVWNMDWFTLCQSLGHGPICSFFPTSKFKEVLQIVAQCSFRFFVKSNPRPGCLGVDSPSVEPIFICPRIPFGKGPQHWIEYNGHEWGHPTEKPLSVLLWMVEGISEIGDSILDPFMGSGTTLEAAKKLGRSAIGIEIEEKYCEIAAKRLAQKVLAF